MMPMIFGTIMLGIGLVLFTVLAEISSGLLGIVVLKDTLCGSENQKLVPSPITEEQRSSPPNACTKWYDNARPTPKPCFLCDAILRSIFSRILVASSKSAVSSGSSTWWYRWKIVGKSPSAALGAISRPGPVSETSKVRRLFLVYPIRNE